MRLWEQFDRMVVFDTETTGIDFRRDRIIEIGAVSLENGAETGSMDLFIRLPEGRRLDPFIVSLTGITEERLEAEGVGDQEAAGAFTKLLEGAERPLIAAYNAQFDLNFLYGLLRPWGLAEALRKPRFLDAMTVYKDRRDYPHKLENAIAAYHLEDRAVNSHRAIDDARAAALLLEAMAEERDDLERYIDLFGTHPKFGVSGRKISSVTYRSQPYERGKPLYELV
ncbi:3'-5' exonuclease [uncultured Oscillibacter sp.]|jgi:DNA polymerase-3 subunit epsilon|uniref:3'-5' exonuclease n=1 Tax=uncultured Oscillibacter sp. TaxID=876091 RepID=UPI0025DE92A7|nr:3'-5' exonuclease [uncultured Oscillibacter sp.]